ncbi:flavin-containing monooxygenase [Streptomyces sp. NPDC091649]|uniref:flavin-containing monooxygenase n=1 Tax=Streptomyces sp. NPDC091649 TaxID=3366004 RepID=UPI00381BCCCB
MPNSPSPSSAGSHVAALTDRTDDRPVYVIGGGPGGLAAAAALRARGVRAVVLEKSDRVGSSWRGHYDRLRLHTTRRWSALPGLKMPRGFGRWVGRDDMVRYLEKYTEHHELEVVTGVEVTRIDPAPDGSGDWQLTATGGRVLRGRAVVVATGFNHTPHVPRWPGSETFTGELLHAAGYRNPAPYADRDVLVVGIGNTGAEIAADLAEGGASRVRIAVRNAPHIVRRSTAGVPAQAAGILIRRVPVWLADRAGRLLSRVATPDLSGQGLARPTTGLYTRMKDGATPVQDVGLTDSVKKGRVVPVATVASFDRDTVVLADGTRITPDAVIAATGYDRALEPLLGHLDVLDARGRPVAHGGRSPKGAPGLYFTGFTNPISGMLRELALDAEKIARTVARTGAGLPARGRG